MWMTRKQIAETLGLALKDRAPTAYREMSESGGLKEFLETRAEVIAESAGEADWSAEIPPEVTGLEWIQMSTQNRNAAWRNALVEGIADLPIEESEAETPEYAEAEA